MKKKGVSEHLFPPLRETQNLLETAKLNDPALIATNQSMKRKAESDSILYVSTIRQPRFLWND
jgi:hypothetical protein